MGEFFKHLYEVNRLAVWTVQIYKHFDFLSVDVRVIRYNKTDIVFNSVL